MTSEYEGLSGPRPQAQPKGKGRLAEQLITSLDTLDSDENERLWLKEADKRYKQYKLKDIPARSAKEVIRDARLAVR